MHAPLFWKDKTKLSAALLPAAALYRFAAGFRESRIAPVRAGVPVICIGNVVVGGSGKTPVALALGERLKARGIKAHYLTRGYKGHLQGPVQVDAQRHGAGDVGDEPLLLARTLPTWVAKDRPAGAKAAAEAGAELIIMDDGFQNPSLHKDVSLIVIDGSYGFGNSRILPAGPLREPVAEAFRRANAIVLMGNDGHGVLIDLPEHLKVLRAHVRPLDEAKALAGLPVLAFAGIARPRKFYRTLQELGCDVRHMVAYADHHRFTARDLTFLKVKAKELEATLVTTEKDYMRLPEEMRMDVRAVPVKAEFEDEAALMSLLPPLSS